MSTITDENTLFSFIVTKQWLGQYSASTGTQDLAPGISNTITGAYNPVANVVNFNPTTGSPLTHGFNTYYKMQGYNNSTNRYEVWFSTGAPQLSPPSGHSLSNIQVVLTWTDR